MTLLQINITKDLIKAVDNVYGLTALIVLVVGTLLISGVRLWFEWKRKSEYNRVIEKSEQKFAMLTSAVKEVSDAMNQMLSGINILVNRYTNEVSIDCALSIVENQFESTADGLLLFIKKVIDENHISENTELVRTKIETEVLISHLHDKEFLNQFKLNGVPLGNFTEKAWVGSLSEILKKAVLVENLSPKQISDKLYQKFEEITLETKAQIRGKDGK